jgi:hypothetical protein
MTHLDISNKSYSQKKGQKSNRQFGSRPLKVKNHLDFVVCRWHGINCWKDLNKGYNLALDIISIGGLHAKLWAPKVARVLIVRISGLPLGNRETKCQLDAGLVAMDRVYYKGESDGFPQVWTVVSIVSPNLPVARFNIKMLQLCINQLVV